VTVITDNTVRDKGRMERLTEYNNTGTRVKTMRGEKDTYGQVQCFKRIGLFLPDVRLTEEQQPVMLSVAEMAAKEEDLHIFR
jgi:hypothetical protein